MKVITFMSEKKGGDMDIYRKHESSHLLKDVVFGVCLAFVLVLLAVTSANIPSGHARPASAGQQLDD
jgi:hypothetical protein